MQSLGTMTIRWKDGKEWKPIPLSAFTTLNLEAGDAWEMLQEGEVVIEFKTDNKIAYLCSTQKWVDHYERRGFKAFTVERGLEILQRSRPGMAEALLDPTLQVVGGSFPDAEVEAITQHDSDQ